MEWGRMGCGLSKIKSNRTHIVVFGFVAIHGRMQSEDNFPLSFNNSRFCRPHSIFCIVFCSKYMKASAKEKYRSKKHHAFCWSGLQKIARLSTLLEGYEPAFTNFETMSPSVRKTYARAYFDAKTDAGREKRIAWMVDRLNKNLKPM